MGSYACLSSPVINTRNNQVANEFQECPVVCKMGEGHQLYGSSSGKCI